MAQSIPAIEEICSVALASHPDLTTQRESLSAARRALHDQVIAHNQQCPNGMSESLAQYPGCMKEKASLQSAMHEHIASTESFNSSVRAACTASHSPDPAPKTPERQYTFAGNGLILGTGAIVYAHRQPGEPEKRMCAAIQQQAAVAHKDYGAGVDCKHYDFVLGMASALDEFTDLKNRVAFDDLSNGKFSADGQLLYDKLRGKQFDELGCHSNGAMLCLAALENEDVKATNVVLYGPQVTRESLEMWDQLVRDHKVNSVKVFINENDIVPGVSISYGDARKMNVLAAPNEPSLIEIESLKRTINETSPRLMVQSFPCSFDSSDPVKCHAIAMYRSKVNCTGKSSGRAVAGTHLAGQADLPEPPLPCEALGAK